VSRPRLASITWITQNTTRQQTLPKMIAAMPYGSPASCQPTPVTVPTMTDTRPANRLVRRSTRLMMKEANGPADRIVKAKINNGMIAWLHNEIRVARMPTTSTPTRLARSSVCSDTRPPTLGYRSRIATEEAASMLPEALDSVADSTALSSRPAITGGNSPTDTSARALLASMFGYTANAISPSPAGTKAYRL